MSSIPQGLGQSKDYDVRTLTVALGGAALEDIAQVGWSGGKDHDFEYTPDNNLIVVHNSPEITGTFAVHNSSPTIDAFITAWQNEEFISANISAPDDAGYGGVQFQHVKVTDVDQSDEEIDGMPDFTAEFQAGDMS